MSKTDKPEKYYQNRARDFVDLVFDKGYFDREVTRKDMRGFEDYLALVMEQIANSAITGERFLRNVNLINAATERIQNEQAKSTKKSTSKKTSA